MYTERFSLGFVSNVLIDAAERLRPGLGTWNDGVREALREVFVRELAGIKPRFLELFHDDPYWEHLERAMLSECFPRYCAVAEKQSKLEAAGYHVWRNGDLLSRVAYALGGTLIGVGLVYVPFIPIPETWTFVILLSMLAGPFLPEAQVALYKRQYRKACEAIVADMQRAQHIDRVYEPLVPAAIRDPDSAARDDASAPTEQPAVHPPRERDH